MEFVIVNTKFLIRILIFQQLELPVDKNDSRSPAMSSYTSGRSPSPSQLLDSLDPTSGNITFPPASNNPSLLYQKHQPSHVRHAQRNSPPNASQMNVEKVVGKGTLSTSVGAFQDHNYYHIRYPSEQQSQITIPKSMQSTGSVDTHSHLQFPSKGLQQSVISPLDTKSSLVSGDPLSSNNKTITNKQTELLSIEDCEKPLESVITDPSEILLKGSPMNPNMSLVNEPPVQQQLKGQLKDKDYSYVKFMRREPPHEYSYPKYIDPTAITNVNPNTTTALSSSATNSSGTPVISSSIGAKVETSPPTNFNQNKNELDDNKSQSSGVKDSPTSSYGSQSGGVGNWARHNNNGSRYKTKSNHYTSSDADEKNPVTSITDYTAYLVKSSESRVSTSQLGNQNDERNSLVGSCCSASGSSCSSDSKKSCTKKHKHHRPQCGKIKENKCNTSGKPHSGQHHHTRTSSQSQFISELDSKTGKSALYSPGGTPRSSGAPGCLGGRGSIIGGGGVSPTNAMTLTCTHCRESFSADDNRRGDCSEAPSIIRKGIETMTCLNCAQALLYHCMSDSEGDYVHPCECSNADGHAVRRWIGLTLLSVLVPCICCYVPLIGCYRCGEFCNVCGGRHQAS